MAAVSFIVCVNQQGVLTLPKEAQETLHLRPGEDVQVSINRVAPPNAPNEKMLAILQDIRERHCHRPDSDPSDTDQLLREARAEAMYSDERVE